MNSEDRMSSGVISVAYCRLALYLENYFADDIQIFIVFDLVQSRSWVWISVPVRFEFHGKFCIKLGPQLGFPICALGLSHS
jgi:hypothetical protein